MSVPPGRPAYPTVVFDLDGTLVDTIGLIVASYQHAFRTVLGHPQDEVRIKAWIGQPLIRAFREVSPEHADELFAVYTAWNEANTERLIRSYAGVDGLLRDLAAAGVAVAVATSKRSHPARWALQLTGLTDLVPVVVTMEDTLTHKPDSAPLLLAVRRSGGEPARAAYVGDAHVDMAAARGGGLTPVGVAWGAGTVEELRAGGAETIVDTVSALRILLLS